jgi:hypothetical protein
MCFKDNGVAFHNSIGTYADFKQGMRQHSFLNEHVLDVYMIPKQMVLRTNVDSSSSLKSENGYLWPNDVTALEVYIGK